jgi:hypothetical protein
MKAHATSYAGRLHRKMREFWPDRNPLRRRWEPLRLIRRQAR